MNRCEDPLWLSLHSAPPVTTMTTLTFEKNLPDSITQADNMPSLPAIAIEVLRLTQDENSTIESLAACLSRDPALSAKILKLSNSSHFSMGQEITNMDRATMVLGFKTVKLMSLSFSLMSEIPAAGSEGGFDMLGFWRRSLVRSVSSRALAKMIGSRHGDEAFLCGLLGHFGRLILARVMTEQYEAVVLEGAGWPSCELEEKRLGFSNTDVCATLLKEWGVPELIYMSTGYGSHPDQLPTDVKDSVREMVLLQQLSGLVERVLCDEEKGAALAELQELMKATKGIQANEVDGFLIGLESGIRETAELFSLRLPGGSSHDKIMNDARLQMVNVSLGTEIDLRKSNSERDRLANEKQGLITKATTDSLTGLPNRSLFDDFLKQNVQARIGSNKPLALGLVMIDIDHFKIFNDTYGHAAGDEVLRHVGRALAEVTRMGDLAARYGGEEFAVVAPQTNPFNLKIMANRIRKAIEAMSVNFDGHTLQVTASLGAACITEFENAGELDKLVKLSDALLYKAKRAGRNRVECFKDFKFPPT